MFSKVKGYIRANDIVFQSADEPELVIQEAFLQVTEADCYGYFKHGEYV